MMATGYLRVSSRAQDHATQRSAIERAAAARGDTITNWYAEKKSGKTLTRPELDRLRTDVRGGRLQGRLYVFKLDRLTRSGIRDTFEVIEELKGHGVELVSAADGFDLSGPVAEVILAVMAWAAKMELVTRGERVAAARDRIEAAGGQWGRPSRLTRDDRSKIVALHTEGRSIRAIAVALKIPRATVGRALAASRKGGSPTGPLAPLDERCQQGAAG